MKITPDLFGVFYYSGDLGLSVNSRPFSKDYSVQLCFENYSIIYKSAANLIIDLLYSSCFVYFICERIKQMQGG
jgi:hypothetical protein